MSRPRNLPIELIRADDDTQVRLTIDQATVDAYAELMADGEELPAIRVCFDGKHYWLADGFHRLHAAHKLKRQIVRAIVREGSQRDAQWEALGSNKHGKPLTTADKINAVKRALMLNSHKSNRDIAAHVGVSHPTIAKYRMELENIGKIFQCSGHQTSDGRQYPAVRQAAQGESRQQVNSSSNVDDIPFDVPGQAGEDDEIPFEVPAASTTPSAAVTPAEDDEIPFDVPPPAANAGAGPAPAPASPPTANPDTPTDRTGKALPAKMVLDFQRTGEITRLCTAISQVKSAVSKAVEAGDPLYAGLNHSAFMADIGNVYRRVADLKPYAVCPYCGADGCRACFNRGWVCRQTYEFSPREMR